MKSHAPSSPPLTSWNCDRKVAALLAHPGHELVIATLLSESRATVDFLSDGSGGSAVDRSEYSVDLIKRSGCRLGAVHGHASDRRFYAAIMNGEVDFFIPLLRQILEQVLEEKAAILVTDPMEYFNPLHDLANTMTDIVVVAAAEKGLHIDKLVYPNEYPEKFPLDQAAVSRHLSPIEQVAKEENAARYFPLAAEKARLAEANKLACIRVETLFEDPIRLADIPAPEDTVFLSAFYEAYGRQAVAAGRYDHHLTFNDHVRPLSQRLVEANLSL